ANEPGETARALRAGCGVTMQFGDQGIHVRCVDSGAEACLKNWRSPAHTIAQAPAALSSGSSKKDARENARDGGKYRQGQEKPGPETGGVIAEVNGRRTGGHRHRLEGEVG